VELQGYNCYNTLTYQTLSNYLVSLCFTGYSNSKLWLYLYEIFDLAEDGSIHWQHPEQVQQESGRVKPHVATKAYRRIHIQKPSALRSLSSKAIKGP